jgi:hypothetical protein
MARLKSILFRVYRVTFIVLLVMLALSRSSAAPGDEVDLIRAFTRPIEFDFVSWTLDALWIKVGQLALGTENYLSDASRKQAMLDYLNLVSEIGQVEYQLNNIYADPKIVNPEADSASLREKLSDLYRRRGQLGPLAETILQAQVGFTIDALGLDTAGQPIPPVLYHTTAPPSGLIVSPRDKIVQITDISISPDLTVDKQFALEEQVDHAFNVSSLVVGIGGVGLYPTMVMQTSDLNWLAEVVSHEWTHNYLTLHPLGLNYETSPELRIINETTASIAGKEIGRAVVGRYYPELLPPPPVEPPPNTGGSETRPSNPPAFNFNAEMHATRVAVDNLLAEGKIEEAESYMEARRQLFVENGYYIRKLNQAYFAFYGAYADQPGGAAGEDPVGAAVRSLRAQSSSLTDFLKRIAWMSSYQQLREAVESKKGE